jgi:predicted DNA-binding transcriptional regulator AlpA
MTTISDNPDELLTKRQVTAALIPVAERTLDRYRFRKTNPLPFVEFSSRCIRFVRSDVEKWVSSNRIGEVR